MSNRTFVGLGLLLSVVLCFASEVGAFRVLPAAHHLEQELGTTETYMLTVLNDTDEVEDLTLAVGDWQRFEDGEHDWGMRLNSARWVFERAFTAGEIVEVVYTVQLPASGEDLGLSGTVQSLSPQATDSIAGAEWVSKDTIGTVPEASASAYVWVGRSVESITEAGHAQIRLRIQCNESFEGLVIYETAAQRVEFTSQESGGGRFDSINRSNAAWIELSHDRLTLQPDESRDVTLTVTMPQDVDGTYWSAVFIESRPQTEDSAGTRVVSIYRTAIKIYTTVFGSEVESGQVVDVQVGETNPLILFALFENTGNVELVVTGSAQIIDRTGTVVRELSVEEFKVLPLSKRIVSIVEPAGNGERLAADIYQAVVSFDYGGENPVVGVRGFRIR